MDTDWFRQRTYKHFDYPVNTNFAKKVMQSEFVARHPFSPLIRYTKETPKYKFCDEKNKRISTVKKRPIMYASHRDACILSYYSKILTLHLDQYYLQTGLSDNVIAYRSLGKANYDFASEVLKFANLNSPVTILAFDVTGFFDNLDHVFLKKRLKNILETTELEDHWYKIFRYITKYCYVEKQELEMKSTFLHRLRKKGTTPIASIVELKTAGVKFYKNSSSGKGIPQGTPISATLSNVYMMEFDTSMKEYCDDIGAMFRRYSDDILIVCKPEFANEVESKVQKFIKHECLEISAEKTERTEFDLGFDSVPSKRVAQYLGFSLDVSGATIRQSSLSRQWRKMRHAIKRTRKKAEIEIAAGRADKVWTKQLRRRFTALQFRNFSSYARRSANSFGKNDKILKQIRRLERAAEKEIQELENLS